MDYQAARERFADRLRTLRLERRLTQERLAELIGKTTEHVSFLERGERAPSFEVLLELAHALEISVSNLLRIDEAESKASFIELPSVVAPVVTQLPNPVQETSPVFEQRQSDVDRLNAAFKGIHEAQRLASEYGINDILQDNGGKVLQVLILLGLRISPGREGNDALDTKGNEYELKTVNRSLNKNAGVTTHHHLNNEILQKYRAVTAWYVAIYEGVELKEIWKVLPTKLEPLFQQWEKKIEAVGASLNNPKIPMRYVREGERVYPTESATPPE